MIKIIQKRCKDMTSWNVENGRQRVFFKMKIEWPRPVSRLKNVWKYSFLLMFAIDTEFQIVDHNISSKTWHSVPLARFGTFSLEMEPIPQTIKIPLDKCVLDYSYFIIYL